MVKLKLSLSSPNAADWHGEGKLEYVSQDQIRITLNLEYLATGRPAIRPYFVEFRLRGDHAVELTRTKDLAILQSSVGKIRRFLIAANCHVDHARDVRSVELLSQHGSLVFSVE